MASSKQLNVCGSKNSGKKETEYFTVDDNPDK